MNKKYVALKFLLHERKEKWNFRVFCVLSSCLTLFIIFWWIVHERAALAVGVCVRSNVRCWCWSSRFENFAHHLCSFYSLVASQLFQHIFMLSFSRLHEAGRCTHKYISTPSTWDSHFSVHQHTAAIYNIFAWEISYTSKVTLCYDK